MGTQYFIAVSVIPVKLLAIKFQYPVLKLAIYILDIIVG